MHGSVLKDTGTKETFDGEYREKLNTQYNLDFKSVILYYED